MITSDFSGSLSICLVSMEVATHTQRGMGDPWSQRRVVAVVRTARLQWSQREAEASIAAATASTSGCRSAVSSAMAAANATFTSSYASAAAAHAIANCLIAYLTHRRQKTKGKGASGKHHSTRQHIYQAPPHVVSMGSAGGSL